MGIWSRIVRGRPDADDVTRVVGEAVAAVPGVSAHQISYHHLQHGGGALNGIVDVADSPTFLAVLRTATLCLVDVLDDDANRVTVYLSGRTPDANAVVPGDLGFSQPPTGRELIGHLAE